MSAPRRLLAAATTLAALGLPATAQAGWLEPLPVSPASAGSAYEIDVAFDAQGDAVAAWTERSALEDANAELWVATRPAGGAWSSPKLLAADNPTYFADDAFEPRVIVHPAGRTVVQWEENTAAIPSRTNVVVAVGEAGDASSFGTPFTVHTPSRNADAAEAVFGPDGSAHLVYNVGLSTDNQVFERSLAPDASAWSAPVAVAPAMNVPQYEFDLAIDGAGNRVLVWASDWAFEDGLPDVNAAVRPADGDWSAPHQLDANVESLRRPFVTVDPQGNALAVWGTSLATPLRLAAFAFYASEPAWSEASSLFEEEEPVSLESSEDGLVHLLTRNGAQLFHRTLAAGGEFSDPHSIDSTISSYEYEPVLAVGPFGEVAVSYMGMDGRTHVALGDAGGWSAPKPVTPEGTRSSQTPAPVAWDNLGSVVAGAVRERAADGPFGADLAVLDRTPPELTDASFQTTGHAGQPFGFSALGIDDWSTVRYEWSFGDGATATGPSVEHTYTAAGTRSLVLRLVSAGGVLELLPHEVEVSAPLAHEEHEEHEAEKPPVVVHPPAGSGTPLPPVVHPPALPTVAELAKVLGTFAKPPVATAKEASFEQSFPGKGLAKWDLFLGRPAAGSKASAAAKAKAVLLGSARKSIAAAGKVKAKIKVSAKRRKALKRAKRPQVFLRTTFTDEAGRTVTTVAKVRVKR